MNGANETKVQGVFTSNPDLLSGAYRSGHCTYAFPEKRLGNDYILDWAIANASSGGFTWHHVELECPQSSPFNKDGSLLNRKVAGRHFTKFPIV